MPKVIKIARIKHNIDVGSTMKVILTQNVPNLGQAGDVKEVKKGYGFNYLLPEGLAELATPGALKSIQHIVARAKKDQVALRAQIASALEVLNGKELKIAAKAKDGKLFGSVTKQDIVKAIASLGGQVDEDVVKLETPIKEVGEYSIELKKGDAQAKLKLIVVAE